ncbi:hypothetical protein [Bacillus cereus]|uniref:hypothetical protein n=1 Tax=Bacillus cereus TaxID=1396 RepID=UPI003A83819B
MRKNTTIDYLNIGIISMLILNLFIFTSRMPFLPWSIEDGWGHLGLLVTSLALLIIFLKSYQLHKNKEINSSQKFIPLVSAIISLFFLLMPLSDFMTIFALIVNVIILCYVSFLKN